MVRVWCSKWKYYYRPVSKLSTPKGVQLRTTVVVKYRKVKYTPVKGGVINFGTSR